MPYALLTLQKFDKQNKNTLKLKLQETKCLGTNALQMKVTVRLTGQRAMVMWV